ncbi:conserved protein of unknown function [Ectopseudomonas oleovorans]|uniref:Uncharacterized protein n=1 Tax=Ectopseudomonas oleovorans TaxID=301 RepID=A0A653B3U4_ECTOL|nr:conserved protein of unknown function [Pseudomonas oleovorans]
MLVTKSAIRPGSNFNRQGGSIFHQRQQQTQLYAIYPSRRQLQAKVRVFIDFLLEELGQQA